MSSNILRIELTKQINALSIDKNELEKIFKTLQEKADEACIIESNYVESLGGSKEDVEIRKSNLQKCALVKLNIKGYNGEDLFGSVNEVFELTIFPERIKTIYVNSKVPYVSQFNYYPRNFFELFIDFSKPKIFDFSIQPSLKTPNDSHFGVEGYDTTWVNGVFRTLDRSFLNKKNSFIHKVGSYDLLIWIVGMPFSFWTCSKFSTHINSLFESNIFLINSAFVYIFFISLFVIRIVFHYSRWVFPMIEFRNKTDKHIIHRATLFIIITTMFCNFLYDILKWILNV